jgi:predicted nucleic acid-binding protein
MSAESRRRGLIDTNVLVLRRWIDLQRTENEFDPIPFDTEAARAFARIGAAVCARGRTPRRRVADLMIASVAVAAELPLYTTNPDDFVGLEGIVQLMAIERPAIA